MGNDRKGVSLRSPARRRRVVIVVVPPVEELDLVGPMQVFGAANRLSKRKIYSLEIATNKAELEVEGEGGMLSFLAQSRLKDVTGPIDSVLLVCGVTTRLLRDLVLRKWLQKASSSARRLGGVCVSSFLLADAGLLDGRRATTHWRFGPELATRHPNVQVESEPIWVKDGNIYTSAGITAGIDLALAWVEEDCGSALAQDIAREFVLFLRRPGGQQQVSVSLAKQASEMKIIHQLQVWIAEHLENNLTVQLLAERVAMSTRNFERVFARETGCTPARYVAQLRIESALRQLEGTNRSIKQIARSCGYVSDNVMRRAFIRSIGMSPGHYRDRLSSANSQDS